MLVRHQILVADFLSIRIKIKMSLDRMGSGNSMFGKTQSEETRKILSEIRKNNYADDKNPRALLNNEQASEIRRLFLSKMFSCKELSKKYGVRKAIIYRIVSYQTYKGVK